MRGRDPKNFEGLRGATPQLTLAKHQLRDWIETKLHSLPQNEDVQELERKLNSELRDAGLVCIEGSAVPCPDELFLGFVNGLSLRKQGYFLIVQTAMGIECGSDESAYVYGWSEEGWRQVWQNEQNKYTEKDYQPQTLSDVLITPYTSTNNYLVLTLGFETWCSSNWRHAYFRAYRLGGNPEAPPLVDGADSAFAPETIRGAVSANDVLVEYRISSIDSGVHNRAAVRHFKIDDNGVKRIDPFALNPRDLIDEWITHEWKEVWDWTESGAQRGLYGLHEKLKKLTPREFIYPTMHCAQTPDLWQVGVNFVDKPDAPFDAKPTEQWFTVRWRPPYTFRMVSVAGQRSPGCTEEDLPADDPTRTLFAGQK